MGDDAEYVLLTDQPWTDDADPLGYDDLAGRLAGLVLTSRSSTPLAIGVLGGWGSGKSSLMRRLEARLKAGTDVETVWFNAWTAEGSSVLEGMIKSVLDAIGPGVLRRAMRNRKLVTGVRLVTTLGLGFFGVGRMVDEIWERFSTDPKARNELPDLLREAMKDWRRQRSAASGRLLVVFVDDLDRCSAANVIQVFEAVKLYLDAPGFVFVIGYDDRMVARALDQQKDLEFREAARYLEKIVQIEYRLPRPDDAQAQALVDALVDRSRTAELLGDAERSLISDSTQRNPRRMKRFLNSFVLARRLDPAAAEFRPRELISLQLLRMSFPVFYDLMVAATDVDVISEFFAYAQVYDWARRGSAPVPAEVESVLVAYGVEPGETAEVTLERLSRQVSEPLPLLVGDRDLRSLLATLPGGPERQRMLERLRRLPPPVPASSLAEATDRPPPTLLGLRVLWIDDNPANNRSETRALHAEGATVTTVTTGVEALSSWDRGGFDVVISDVSRDGEAEAGFRDLDTLRRRTGWTGPAVFYTSRISPDWRAEANRLGAEITTSFSGVRDVLTAAADGGKATGGGK